MTGRVALGVALLAVLLLCGLIGTVVVTEEPATAVCSGTTNGPASAAVDTRRVNAVGDWTTEQVSNAAVIVAVGQQRQIPARGWVVAVATAMVESRLRNLDYGDRDSLGLFQQRPSQGWGTPAQVREPVYAAGKFYDALARVPGWEKLPVTVAAQKVQRSALPDAYADFENDAETVVAAVTGVAVITDLPGASLADCDSADVGQISASGWIKPLSAPVGSPYGPRNGRLHAGVDISTARNTVIRAASAGKVLWSGCDSGTGNCDVDGTPQSSGCGWYVDLVHAGGIGTRYCHMVRRPDVREGDSVTVGQPIGLVGTSGRSSGEHLHFEFHVNICSPSPRPRCDLSSRTSTDPVSKMRALGAPLGAETRS